MTKTPPIPPEQRPMRGHAPDGGHPDIEGRQPERRDRKTGVESFQPGDADVNFKTQGRQANTRQNLTPQRRVQDR